MAMKAAADPTRVRILELLEAGELCGCRIVAVLELSQSTISRHLFLLGMAGQVKERKERKWVHYALDGSRGSSYAGRMLPLVKGWRNGDPFVERDKKREAMARKPGPANICERGMTLPSRGAAKCGSSPRNRSVGRSLRRGRSGTRPPSGPARLASQSGTSGEPLKRTPVSRCGAGVFCGPP